jgi:hypothetical protein
MDKYTLERTITSRIEKYLFFLFESTRYVQENLTDKPFEYRYYSWDHQPRNFDDIARLSSDIAEWIIKNDW